MKKGKSRFTHCTRHHTHTHHLTMTMTNLKTDLDADKHALCVSEFIKEKLYFVTFRNKTHRNTTEAHYFTTDDELVYHNYYADFGPLNLAAIARYLSKLNYKLKSPTLSSKVVIHFTSMNEKKRVNAAFLMAVFAIVQLNMSPTEAFNKLSFLKYPYLSFQDASLNESQYKIRLIDCLNAIRKAVYFGLINFDDFNVEEYEKMDNIRNGDVSWIVPHKLLAFSGPVDDPKDDCYHTPEYYLEYFRANNVKTVIRLNVKMYNAKSFTNAGLSHYDLYFVDGSVPSHEILTRFLDIVENCSGAVAVHCKAGLGRTGCLIGAYLIKHYRMTALEAIAWMRICRPGCIIGYQQTWLEEMEPSLWNMGDTFRVRYHGGSERIPHHKYGIYSYRNIKTQDQEREYFHTQSVEGEPPVSMEADQPVETSAYSNLTKYPRATVEGSRASDALMETQGDKLNTAKKLREIQQIVQYKQKNIKRKVSDK